MEESEPEQERCPKCGDLDYLAVTFERKKKMVCLSVKLFKGEECNYEKEIKNDWMPYMWSICIWWEFR